MTDETTYGTAPDEDDDELTPEIEGEDADVEPDSDPEPDDDAQEKLTAAYPAPEGARTAPAPSGSVSGLSKAHRAQARRRIYDAAWLTYSHKDRVHYTQGSERWQGIDKDFNARMGEFPKYADCSAFATWCIWNGIQIPFGCRDTVNGAAWRAGYTGTMLSHGKEVVHIENVLIGDCVLYGGGTGKHTAIVVGKKNGKVMVISHGSESGPYYLPYDYRSDINQIRRYI